MHQIEAGRVAAADQPAIGEHSFIQANEVVLGRNIRIGSHVNIVCDRLELADGCSIGDHSTLLSPEITLAEGCSLGKSVEVELNQFFRLGRLSSVGHRVKATGQGVSSGEFLWMRNEVVIGGGGSQGPNAYLRIGSRSTISEKCILNLSDQITLGDATGLSYNVTILTHGAWQPALMGFTTKFGPVKIGNYCILYLSAIILPGLTIGDYATVGAGAVVGRDVPDYSMAIGNPAKILRSAPTPLTEEDVGALLVSILSDYALTLDPKGGKVAENGGGFLAVDLHGERHTIAYIRRDGAARPQPSISLAFGPLPAEFAGKCHFNLRDLTADGEPSELSEDLRDYLRRRAIQIFTAKPFRSMPLVELSRLRSRLSAGKRL